MTLLVHRLSRVLRWRLLRGWRLPLALALAVFVTSWPLMALAEPDGELTGAGTYWWYFLVTAATVGYGDYSPTTGAGRLVGAYVIVGGIVTLTVLFTRLAEHVESARGRRTKGLIAVEARDHVVLLGYTAGRTERIVAELAAEGRLALVLCAGEDQAAAHPMPDRPDVRFVRGDLAGDDVMTRAAVADAATVVIDTPTDDAALAVLVAVHHARPHGHVVVALRDLGRSENLRYVDPEVQTVQWHAPNLLVEEVQEPGISQVYADLTTHGGHGGTYAGRLADAYAGRPFGEVQAELGRRHRATVIAVRDGDGLRISPSWDAPVAAGTRLYYLAPERVEDRGIVLPDRRTRASR